jgi:hypothetical protein
LTDPALVTAGETMLVVTDQEFAAAATISGLVNQKTGKIVNSSRTAVIDPNSLPVPRAVVNIISADPLLDSVPGMILVLSQTATIGQIIP